MMQHLPNISDDIHLVHPEGIRFHFHIHFVHHRTHLDLVRHIHRFCIPAVAFGASVVLVVQVASLVGEAAGIRAEMPVA